jgi:hypothetical protein
MVWTLLPLALALGLLLLTLANARRARAIERQWEQALHDQDRRDTS